MNKNFWIVQYNFDKKWGVKCKEDDDMTEILISNTHVVYDNKQDAINDKLICEALYTQHKLRKLDLIIEYLGGK